MSAPTDPFADHSRSGDDVAEAIEVAERGSSVQEMHDRAGGRQARCGARRADRAAIRR